MLIFPITVTNLALLTAINGGVQPLFQMTENGTYQTAYLVVEPEKPNRIITHKELMKIRETVEIETTTRKFHYTK